MLIDREYLIVSFHLQLQVYGEVSVDLPAYIMQVGFITREDHHVIGIAEIILYTDSFLEPMIEITQVEISEILAEVIADRDAWRTVDDLVKEPKQIRVFNLPPERRLQDIMID